MPMPLSYNPEEPQYNQEENWTCAACSLAWLNRALYIDHATDEYSAASYIGQPENINPEWGLMDASGQRLVECLREQGAPAFHGWLDWSTTYDLATQMPLLIGGINWCHWVGVRFADNGILLLANSAPGWQGITQTMEEMDFHAWGPFAVVAVPLLIRFPPLPTT